MPNSAQAQAENWFRPEVLSLPAYVPGGVVEDPEVIKLASNENPFPPLAQVQAAIQAASGQVHRYPDMFARALTADLAQFHGWDGGIVVGNGSTAIIEKVLQAVVCPGQNVVYAWRSFEAYPIAVQAAGGESVQVPLTEAGAHDLEAMAAAVGPDTAAAMLCSPNNPTGVALTHTEVAGFLAKVPASVPVLLDEAYIDFVEMDDAVRSRELLDAYPNLVVLRTFSKAYGLAGLRVGYALCAKEFAGPLASIMTPFGVNLLAQAAASAALRSQIQVRQRVAKIDEERARMLAGVRERGLQAPEAQANFIWLALGEKAVAFAEACEAQKLRVRTFPGEGVRVSVGEKAGTDRLFRALDAFLG